MNKVKEDWEKKLKISICPTCSGWVRASVLDYFNTDRKARNEFLKEVGQHNLSVREISLAQWKEEDIKHCSCEKQ